MTPLRQRMIEDMQLRNLTPETQRNYVHHVAAFARYFDQSPELLDLEAVRQYQLYLLNERKLSPETINQYISSVKFLYLVTLEMPWTAEYFPRVRRAYKLPVVLSQEEVLAFFDHVPSLKYRAALMTCYGAGLRVSEAVALKISDIDSQRMLIRVAQGKGQKDRYAMLSPAAVGGVTPLLPRCPPEALPVSLLAAGAAHLPHLVTTGLPRSRPARGNPQASHGSHSAPLLRHPPAGKRYRHPHHPGAARP